MTVISEINHLLESRVHIESFEDYRDIYIDNGTFFKGLVPIWRGTKSMEDDFTYDFAHVYKFEKYYVVVESFLESCEGCYHSCELSFDQILEGNIRKSYVVDTFDECIEYVSLRHYVGDGEEED